MTRPTDDHDIAQRLRAIAAAAAADASDLPLLAELHRQIEEVGAAAGDPAAGLREAAGSAGKLLERVILHEEQDAERALAEVVRHVEQIAGLIISGGGGTTASPVAVPVAGGAQQPISADDAPLIAEFVGEARGHIESAEAGVLRVEEHPDDLEAINAIFRAFHTIKGVAGFLNLKAIGSLAHAAENLLDLGRQGQIKLVGVNVDVILESIDLMKVLIARLEEAMSSGFVPSADERLPQLLERLHACATGQATAVSVAAVAAAPSVTAEPRDAKAQAALETPQSPALATATAAPAPAASSASATTSTDASVKVSTSRLDSLIDMVGELVIAESMVRQGLGSLSGEDQKLARNVAHLGKITRNLQDLSMSMRMVPIQATFQKMARLVRDLGRKSGKQTELTMVGAETELDRNVVEAIADPLVHMIRNACDHGIEPPDERQRAGKPAAGQVELKAYHQSGNIVIEINDDGRGLRKDKILKKALAAGLVKEGQQLADSEIFNLIFHAGLSTADKVTDVSGRGVGMDVVKRNVEALRGQIDIRSVEGKGSTFTIRLPLTLAVIDGLAVRVGAERYIVPITSVEQSLRPRPEQLSTVQQRGEMCTVRGRLLPVIRLHRLFNLTPRTEQISEGLVVIVQDNQRRCCLFVDELLGQQQVVIKSLGAGIGKVAGISGGAILGDGNVSLILDVPGVIDSATTNDEITENQGALS